MAFSSYSSLNYVITKNTGNVVTNPSYWYKFNSWDISGTTILNYGSSQKNGYIATDNSGTLPTLGTSTINSKTCGVINLNETYKNYVNMTTTLGNSSTYFTIGGSTGLSISCWFNYANFTQIYARIFDFTTAINNSANSCLLASNYNNTSEFFVENINASKSQYTPSFTMSTNTWYHMVWVIPISGVWSIYLNNTLQTTMSPTSVTAYPSVLTYQYGCIGRPCNNTSFPLQYFTGMIADFRTYNYPLSTTDISYLYNNPV